MKIQSLGYILVETENLSAWDHYGQEVCGFMKHPDFSDEEKLCLKIDHEPFRFLVQNGPESGDCQCTSVATVPAKTSGCV